MFLTIALNVIFAVLVAGAIVGHLGRSILTSRTEHAAAAARPARHATAAPPARDATAHRHGRRQAPARALASTS